MRSIWANGQHISTTFEANSEQRMAADFEKDILNPDRTRWKQRFPYPRQLLFDGIARHPVPLILDASLRFGKRVAIDLAVFFTPISIPTAAFTCTSSMLRPTQT
jgi:hypothetical protein